MFPIIHTNHQLWYNENYHPQGPFLSQCQQNDTLNNTFLERKIRTQTSEKNTFSVPKTFHTKTASCSCGDSIHTMACFAFTNVAGRRICVALSKQLKINIAAVYYVRAEHYSLPRYVYTHTKTSQRLLQLVTNIADGSCEKLISFNVYRVHFDKCTRDFPSL